MPRAFFSRAAALFVLCVWVLGCSASDRPDGVAEAQVSSRSQALGGPCTTDPDCAEACATCQAGTCVVAPVTVVCRAAVGLCDVDDFCDGVSSTCPVLDVKQPDGTECRAAAGVCDAAETCSAGVCPPVDAKQPDGTECRAAAAGGCDVAETCSAGSCPPDAKEPDGTECRAAVAGGCDVAETCSAGACPPDAKQPDGTECRAAAAGGCDVAETCSAGSCPPDAKEPDGTECRAAVAGGCDVAETCSAGSCPPDAKEPDGTECRAAAAGGCDVAETCSAGSCPPDAKEPDGTVCRTAAAGGCDVAETCSAGSCPSDAKEPDGTVCRAAAAGGCDVAETCSGGVCPPLDAKEPDGTVCRPEAAGGCDVAETCSGGVCPPVDAKRPGSFVCRPVAGMCDVAENCAGGNACPSDLFKPAGPCRPAAGLCDVAESCSGNDAQCPENKFQPTSVECRPFEAFCDLHDFCDGVTAVCPNTFAPSTEQCRGILNGNVQCDQPEFCTGSSTGCPANVYKPTGTPCDDQFDCTVSDVCNGTTGACAGTADNSRCEPEKHLCGFVFCAVNKGCDFTPNPKTKVCRAAVGSCDVAENCDGTNQDCPVDVIKTNTDVCQSLSCANATLKPEISCTGLDGVCPTVPDSSCGSYACGSATECRTTCVTSSDCGGAYYCESNVCVPRIGAGQPCKLDSECPISNNHCVDGVCCDTTCTGQCEACNLPTSAGTCVGVTGTPVAPRTACAADGTKCDGFCDPSNHTACQFPVKGTSCKEASCDATSNNAFAESFCTGKGSCAVTAAMACAPYACFGAACAGNCTADAQCAKDAYCQAGVCTPKAALAVKCTSDKQCGSGHCADGVCCDTACTGQCEACTGVTGAKAGSCSAVTGEPLGKRSACAATDPACGGACDGSNRLSCRYPGQDKACREGSCSDGQATVKAACDGHGACPAALMVSCEKGCEGQVCAGDQCLLDADCKDAGKYCAAGVCTNKGAPGSACSAASACESGFCTDGVCCDSACLGQCEACDNSASMGTCSAVTKGDSPHGGRTSCATDGSVCGGLCDGTQRASCKYPFDVVCRPGSCALGAGPDDPATAIVEVSCVGNGSCPTEQQQLCGADGCDDPGELCNGACAVDKNACRTDEYCSAGECVPRLEIASNCANDAQCGSHFCVDGVCCNARCGDQCAACDVPGSVGTCSPVSGGTHGGRAACGGVGTCGSVCDGSVVASCSFADEKVSCGEPFCSEGVKGKAPVCDGEGLCAPAETSACKSFECNGTECSTACTKSADCVKELECREGQCLPPLKIAAVDEGSCGCSLPGSHSGAPAGVLVLLGCCAAVFRRRRRAA